MCSFAKKAQSNEVFLSVCSVVKITIQFLMFLLFQILRVRNSAWNFLGLIFGPGIFWGFRWKP